MSIFVFICGCLLSAVVSHVVAIIVFNDLLSVAVERFRKAEKRIKELEGGHPQ